MQAAIQFFKDALRHEVKASAFYNKAAEITQDDESRMLFLDLAGMEDGHARQLLEKVQDAPCGQAFDGTAYLKELESDAEPSISPKESQLIESGPISEVLKMAIALEEKASKTYENLAKETTDPNVKQYCLDLAKEEKKHAQELTNQLYSLDMSEEERPGL